MSDEDFAEVPPLPVVPPVVFLRSGPNMDVNLGSWDELVVARERLLTEGWDVVPYDLPDCGIRGFAGNKAGETSCWLRWMVYGAQLEPSYKVCSTWEEFVRELEFRRDEDMEKSDDLVNRRVGFVTYGRAASGRSEVFRLDVPVLMAGGAPAREALVAILLRSKHPGREELERAALSPGFRGR